MRNLGADHRDVRVLRVEGFEHARMLDPYSAGVGNSIRYLAMTPCETTISTASRVAVARATCSASIF